MERLGNLATAAGLASGTAEPTCEPFSLDDYEQRRMERYNATPGELNKLDGYDCPACLNRGYFMEADRGDAGIWRESLRECECMKARANLRWMKQSGLQGLLDAYTFDKYEIDTPWRERIKETAFQYIADDRHPKRWFFIGGAIGVGKSHICTAIAGELLKCEPVLYVLWPDENAVLKACITDGETYVHRIQRLKTANTLYLDDMFKMTIGANGTVQLPTGADMRLAHELLNARYATGLKTIISSERMLPEIVEIDQAVGGRISERARGYTLNIVREPDRDYRMKLSRETL